MAINLKDFDSYAQVEEHNKVSGLTNKNIPQSPMKTSLAEDIGIKREKKARSSSFFSSFNFNATFAEEIESAKRITGPILSSLSTEQLDNKNNNKANIGNQYYQQKQSLAAHQVVNNDEQWKKFQQQMKQGGGNTGIMLKQNLNDLLQNRVVELKERETNIPSSTNNNNNKNRATLAEFAASLIFRQPQEEPQQQQQQQQQRRRRNSLPSAITAGTTLNEGFSAIKNAATRRLSGFSNNSSIMAALQTTRQELEVEFPNHDDDDYVNYDSDDDDDDKNHDMDPTPRMQNHKKHTDNDSETMVSNNKEEEGSNKTELEEKTAD